MPFAAANGTGTVPAARSASRLTRRRPGGRAVLLVGRLETRMACWPSGTTGARPVGRRACRPADTTARWSDGGERLPFIPRHALAGPMTEVMRFAGIAARVPLGAAPEAVTRLAAAAWLARMVAIRAGGQNGWIKMLPVGE